MMVSVSSRRIPLWTTGIVIAIIPLRCAVICTLSCNSVDMRAHSGSLGETRTEWQVLVGQYGPLFPMTDGVVRHICIRTYIATDSPTAAAPTSAEPTSAAPTSAPSTSTTISAAPTSAQTLLYYSTFNDDSDFDYSAGSDYVTFVTGDGNCMMDGNCARMAGTNPSCYLQTAPGVIDTTGYADILIVLKLTLNSWSSGSLLKVAWKMDPSHPTVYTLATYEHDDLTELSLQTLYYDLGSGSPAENNSNFAIYLSTYFDGNGMSGYR